MLLDAVTDNTQKWFYHHHTFPGSRPSCVCTESADL